MEEIFTRNIGAITLKEQQWLNESTVFVAGAGGLGGFVAEYLVRMGVGNFRIVDCDVFDQTNINRQITSTSGNVGKAKVLELQEHLKSINKNVVVTAFYEKFTVKNAKKIIGNSLVAIDAFDNIEDRLQLEKSCEEMNIPLVFGGVSRTGGQVSTIYPGDRTESKIFENSDKNGAKPSVTSMTVGVIGGIQAMEAVNLLVGRPTLKKKLLIVDLEDYSIKKLDL